MTTATAVDAALLSSLPLPGLGHHVDKYSRGTVLIAGASATSVGAVMLSGLAAFRAGAGKVTLAVPQPLALAIAAGFPEAGVHGFAGTLEGDPDAHAAAKQIGALLPHTDAALIGPGFTNAGAAREVARLLLDSEPGPAFVIDALSLTGLWDQQKILAAHAGRVVITPHAGEMAQLTGASIKEICADPHRFARQAASHLQCMVVLKGAVTVIAPPDGPLHVQEADIAGLATSGSGDVLAGILAGLLARGASPLTAAVWSVSLHAQAGASLARKMGPLGLLARELPGEIPLLMTTLAAQSPDQVPG